jgi:hypothetical protein
MDQIWRLLAYSGYGGQFDYNDRPWSDSDKVLPPDPIDVAGQAEITRLRKRCEKLGFHALKEAFDLITAANNPALSRWWNGYKRGREEKEGNNSDPPRALRFSNAKYAEHLRSFASDMKEENQRILQRVKATELYHCSTYFEVPKTKDTSRLIFNGKELSKHWKIPRPVNICDTGSLIKKILSVSEAKGQKLHVVVGDFRHWFHQIRVSEALSRHFGIALREKNGGIETFRWRTLPMGWSHSPFIAQCLAWGVLCHREDGQRPLFDEGAFHGSELPTFVPTRENGFLTVYYDNFILVTSSEEEAQQFKARLENSTKMFKVSIKEGSYLSYVSQPDQVMQWDFLGITFKRLFVDDRYQLEWHPLKRAEWRETWTEQPDPKTCLDCARWLGRCLFFQVMALKHLSGTKDGRTLARILSSVGRTAAAFGWKERYHWDTDDLAAVRSIWMRAIGDEFTWNRSTIPQVIDIAEATRVMATDACTTYGFGYIALQFDAAEDRLMRDAPDQELAGSWRWDPHDSRDIFLMEMEAATKGIRAACSAFPEEPIIILACDNTAVCFALRAGYSSNTTATEMMKDVLEFMDRILVLPIKSAENPADCHSRGVFTDCDLRIGLLERAIHAHRLGRRTDKTTEYNRQESERGGILRHAGCEDEDVQINEAPGEALATDVILGWSAFNPM